mmetsp:Transcript_25117/g.72370  ORF Transcript_25117/g.72370 Transcript_25117/m.72370 type:complete len:244 (-) Transcript_25117:625-1356(-)
MNIPTSSSLIATGARKVVAGRRSSRAATADTGPAHSAWLASAYCSSQASPQAAGARKDAREMLSLTLAERSCSSPAARLTCPSVPASCTATPAGNLSTTSDKGVPPTRSHRSSMRRSCFLAFFDLTQTYTARCSSRKHCDQSLPWNSVSSFSGTAGSAEEADAGVAAEGPLVDAAAGTFAALEELGAWISSRSTWYFMPVPLIRAAARRSRICSSGSIDVGSAVAPVVALAAFSSPAGSLDWR